MRISARLLENNTQIAQKIAQSLAPLINATIFRMKSSLPPKMAKILREALVRQPEYNSLLHGTLKAELGLNNAENRINSIIETWVSTISVDVEQWNGSHGGIRIGMVMSDYRDVLSKPESVVVTQDGKHLPYLQWLLLYGTKIIIKDYSFHPEAHEGRSGFGIMVQDNRSGKDWRVPERFAGTYDNNWVVRAIASIPDVQIYSLLEQELIAKI